MIDGLWTSNPTCVVCGGAGTKIRHNVWTHTLPFGGDGVGPNSHSFTTDPEWIEADRRHKDKIESMRQAVPHRDQHYYEFIGAEEEARRSQRLAEWRRWENEE